MKNPDTIAAIATAPGRSGVGIIRISGSAVHPIAKIILGAVPRPRYATYSEFKTQAGEVIDLGLALYFPAPHSFTGEDILELQGHGGAVVLDRLMHEVLQHGARLAKPGEFSERAFLNDKIDLAQAEAIADLIDSASQQAAKCAIRSLQGKFSERIHRLIDELIQLRMYVEAAIDFPEEEIDFLSDGKVQADLEKLIQQLKAIIDTAQQGVLLREGITVVIAGKPNAGKSTLLNQLSGRESAIVTEIPGTTRDVMREQITIEGLPIHIIDTAGLRDSEDPIEQEGIRRAWQEIQKADHLLLLIDVEMENEIAESIRDLKKKAHNNIPLTIICNKIDKINHQPKIFDKDNHTIIYLSAKTGDGLDLLKQHLTRSIGYQSGGEGEFIARRRHLQALEAALSALQRGANQLQTQRAGELLAEECRQAQQVLGEITGEFTTDDLLAKIFSNFCIGK